MLFLGSSDITSWVRVTTSISFVASVFVSFYLLKYKVSKMH